MRARCEMIAVGICRAHSVYQTLCSAWGTGRANSSSSQGAYSLVREMET